MQQSDILDLLVIGGGINGVGIARDAAGRGLSVALCEKDDLGQGTSSRSGKLIHGGLRYLEYYDFRLVREALMEREVLLKAAPHIIWPMRFVLPHAPEQRPAWLVRLGLFLYDHIAGRVTLPRCRSVNLRTDPVGRPIHDAFTKGYEYSDCWVDDARLVALNALDAAAKGARILTRTEALSAHRDTGVWTVKLRAPDGSETHVKAKVLVNAAGPWVQNVINNVVGANTGTRVKLVKGSHIIVRKFWDGPQAYVLQNHDKRLIFVNPYQDDLCLIGTTDVPVGGSPETVAIEDSEIDYLLAAVNRYMRKALSRADIVSSYAGVRPLYDDNADNPSAITRDYVFDVEGSPPVLSVFGGKITTYRKLAEHALEKLKPFFPEMKGAWTAKGILPGGDFPERDFQSFLARVQADRPWLPARLALHYCRLYGSRVQELLKNCRTVADLGHDFGAGLHAVEVAFLRNEEWALTADDILSRRTKFGLHLSERQKDELATYLSQTLK